MKKLIRKQVFETNSSSCHSLSIVDGMTYNDIPICDNYGVVHINSGEFGWEQETYYNFNEKASYLAVYIRDWTGDKLQEFKEIFENVIKEVSGCDEISYETNFWEKEEVFYDITAWNSETKQSEKTGEKRSYMSNLGDGYIDHQSVESQDLHYLFEDTNQIKSFLFNNNSYLETDNDNH